MYSIKSEITIYFLWFISLFPYFECDIWRGKRKQHWRNKTEHSHWMSQYDGIPLYFTSHCEAMMTSSNGNISRVIGHAGNSPVTGEFPTQRPVTRSFDIFFDPRLNKRLIKQLWGRWFETRSCSLWRHCNGGVAYWSPAWCRSSDNRTTNQTGWRLYLRPGQNGQHYANDSFKAILFNENIWIKKTISFKCVLGVQCRIWSWCPMPCEKYGPREYVNKNRGRRPTFLSLLRPESLFSLRVGNHDQILL